VCFDGVVFVFVYEFRFGLVADDFGRETGSVLLLWELHEPYLSPPGSDAG
jgi:hypothetical protein